MKERKHRLLIGVMENFLQSRSHNLDSSVNPSPVAMRNDVMMGGVRRVGQSVGLDTKSESHSQTTHCLCHC